MSIYWTPELSVGETNIDHQHKELFERVNRLVEACSAGKCIHEIEPLMHFLESYVDIHFNDEEQLMLRRNYPDRVRHAKEHARFRLNFTDLKKDLIARGPQPQLVTTINETIIDWLFDHVCIADRALGKFLETAK